MSGQGGNRFPKRARLAKRSEFLSLSRGGRKIQTPHFTVIHRPNQASGSRLGVTVSRAVGKAVVRNRVKRLLRELFRRRCRELPRHDFVIVARKGAQDLSFHQVAAELEGAFSHAVGRPG